MDGNAMADLGGITFCSIPFKTIFVTIYFLFFLFFTFAGLIRSPPPNVIDFYRQVDITHIEFYILTANFLFLNTNISFYIS